MKGAEENLACWLFSLKILWWHDFFSLSARMGWSCRREKGEKHLCGESIGQGRGADNQSYYMLSYLPAQTYFQFALIHYYWVYTCGLEPRDDFVTGGDWEQEKSGGKDN